MARGLPDWWVSMRPAKTVFGVGQTSWWIAEVGDIAGGGFADFCEYTVPVGFILNIGYIGGSCSGPGIMKVALLVAGVPIVTGNWDLINHILLPDTSLYQVPAPYPIAARLYNQDSITLTFSCGIVGYEEVRAP